MACLPAAGGSRWAPPEAAEAEVGGLLSGAVGRAPSSEYFLGLWTQLWPWGPDLSPVPWVSDGTACLKQGWVGRALRRWPPGRGGCVLLPEDQGG